MEAVHMYVVPATLLGFDKLMEENTEPEQTVCVEGVAATVGNGLMVILKLMGGPGQPLAVPVTVIVATIGVLPVLIAAKAGNTPVPEAGSPIAGFELVQLNVVPATTLVKEMALVVALWQYTCGPGFVITGVGLTVMVTVMGVPAQPLAVGVMV